MADVDNIETVSGLHLGPVLKFSRADLTEAARNRPLTELRLRHIATLADRSVAERALSSRRIELHDGEKVAILKDRAGVCRVISRQEAVELDLRENRVTKERLREVLNRKLAR